MHIKQSKPKILDKQNFSATTMIIKTLREVCFLGKMPEIDKCIRQIFKTIKHMADILKSHQ